MGWFSLLLRSISFRFHFISISFRFHFISISFHFPRLLPDKTYHANRTPVSAKAVIFRLTVRKIRGTFTWLLLSTFTFTFYSYFLPLLTLKRFFTLSNVTFTHRNNVLLSHFIFFSRRWHFLWQMVCHNTWRHHLSNCLIMQYYLPV